MKIILRSLNIRIKKEKGNSNDKNKQKTHKYLQLLDLYTVVSAMGYGGFFNT